MYDGGIGYSHGEGIHYWNHIASFSAWGLALAQVPFIINLVVSLRGGKKASDNPWDSTTLEWATPTPPPHGNFATAPSVYRGPYEYSVPGHDKDYLPQHHSSSRYFESWP